MPLVFLFKAPACVSQVGCFCEKIELGIPVAAEAACQSSCRGGARQMQPHRSLSTGSSAPAASASAAPSVASGFAAAGVMGGATLMASRAKTAKNSKINKARSQKSVVYAKKDITESGLDHLVASVQELLKHLVLYTFCFCRFLSSLWYV